MVLGLFLWGNPYISCHLWVVSNYGRARDTFGRVKVGSARPDGYRKIHISKKDYLMHRLVIFAFRGPPPSPWYVVHHIDGNRENNCISNLDYITRSENAQQECQQSKSSPTQGRSRPVLVRLIGTSDWQLYGTQRTAAQAIGISSSSASRCCHGKIPSAGGYELAFEEEPDMPGEHWIQAICPSTGTELEGYLVSSCGRICGPNGSKALGHMMGRSGYIGMWYRGRCLRIHRIVVCSFRGMPEVSYRWEVNHLDGNKSNNFLENLNITTHSENIQHAYTLQPGMQQRTTKAIAVEGRALGTSKRWERYASVRSAARAHGVASSKIFDCCKNRAQSAKGYEWRYASSPESCDLEGEVWRTMDEEVLASYHAAWSTGVEGPNG